MAEKTESPDPQSDFGKIQELHQRDMKASKQKDFQTLRSLLTDDAVMKENGKFIEQYGTVIHPSKRWYDIHL